MWNSDCLYGLAESAARLLLHVHQIKSQAKQSKSDQCQKTKPAGMEGAEGGGEAPLPCLVLLEMRRDGMGPGGMRNAGRIG